MFLGKKSRLLLPINTILLMLSVFFLFSGPRALIITIKNELFHSSINYESWMNRLLVLDLCLIYVLVILEIFLIIRRMEKNVIWLFPCAIIFSFALVNILILLYKNFSGFYSIWDFGDLTGRNIIETYAALGTYESNYPPLASLLFKFLYLLFPIEYDVMYVNNYVTCIYMLFSAVCIYVLVLKYIGDNLFGKVFAFSLLLSGPMLFLYERQNLISVALVFTLLYLVCYQSDNKYERWLALLCLAIAANIKLYPAIFGLLLIKEKRWKDAMVCAAEGIAIYIFPALVIKIKTGVSIVQLVESNMKAIATYTEQQIGYTVSIKSIVARILLNMGATDVEQCAKVGSIVLMIYVVISLVGFAISKDKHVQLLLLTLLCILVPSVTYWYTITLLIIPLCEKTKERKNDWKSCIWYGVYLCLFICTYNGWKYLEPNNYWQLIVLWGLGIGSVIKERVNTGK